MSHLLEVQGLTTAFSADYGETVSVDHVSFHIEEGETLGLVGESGCGKSTLAKLITRLIDPDNGTICLNGKDITRAKGKSCGTHTDTCRWYFSPPRGHSTREKPSDTAWKKVLKIRVCQRQNENSVSHR